LFPSDLYLQPGDQPPVVRENLSAEMLEVYRRVGIFAHEDPVRAVADRIASLAPEWIHAMHGGTIAGEALPYFTTALRAHEFAYRGMLLGREVGAPAGAGPRDRQAAGLAARDVARLEHDDLEPALGQLGEEKRPLSLGTAGAEVRADEQHARHRTLLRSASTRS
jgi:hypothetical protein